MDSNVKQIPICRGVLLERICHGSPWLFSLSSAGQYWVFVGSDPFLSSMDLFRKKDYSVFRGFGSFRRRDGSVLEGTICKQFVSNAKKRKNLKPCRGFKSFRSLAFRIQFLKKCIFGSSNPSTRRKIENGSMEIRKKLGAKKAEKSLEISAFLVFSRSDLNRPKDLSCPFKIDPYCKFFRNRSVFFGRWVDLSLGDVELRKFLEKRFPNYAGKRIYVKV